MKILSIIPARGGSKGIPRKNIVDLAGKPLIAYTIDCSLKTGSISRTVVSTEDREIAEVAREFGAEVPFLRPNELAQDDTPSFPVFFDLLIRLENDGYYPDIVAILQPTSPLRTPEDIEACIKKLVDTGCDSVMTVKELDHPVSWVVELDENGKVTNPDESIKITRRQDGAKLFIPNGAVFVTKREVIIDMKTIRGPDTRAVIMPQERSVDVDTPFDLKIIRKLLEEG